MPIGASRERSLTDTPLPPPSLQTVGWLKCGNNFSQAKIFYSRDIKSYFNSLQWENQIHEVKPRRISFSLVCKTRCTSGVYFAKEKYQRYNKTCKTPSYRAANSRMLLWRVFFILEIMPALHKLYNLDCSTHSLSPALIFSS